MPKIISEYGIIRKASEYECPDDSFSEIFVSDRTFSNLKLLAFSGVNDLIMSYLTHRGKEQIKLKNYVGLIQTNDGTQIEILPKSSENSVKEARKTLLKMLQVLPNSPYQSLSLSLLNSYELPLFEVFVNVFLDELEKLLAQGLGRNYESQEANQTLVKGKILITENCRRNAIRKEQIFVAFEDFLLDIPQNRLLKKCLQMLCKQSFTAKTQQRLLQNLAVFDEVSFSRNVHQDLQKIEAKNRIFERYEKVLNWTNIFLNNQSFSPFSGNTPQLALLFPMEVLFENYVGKAFRKYFSDDFEVKLQDRGKYLINKHLENPKFRLIPDIVVSNKDQTFVFDTKWKMIDATKSSQNYGIEQSDLYQMYAYGKKYNAQQLFLIYPSNPNFQQPLQVFDYEEGMSLQILPFELGNSTENEIAKIINLLHKVNVAE